VNQLRLRGDRALAGGVLAAQQDDAVFEVAARPIRWCEQNDGRPSADSPQSRPSDPWSVLGLTRTASKDEIKAAYRRLAMMYHPDRVASMGPEIIAVAQVKMTEINAAYASLEDYARQAKEQPENDARR